MKKNYFLVIPLVILIIVGISAKKNEALSKNGETKILYVAAANSISLQKSQANYICDGTNDEIVIQNAINERKGKKVVLLEGVYNKDNAEGISIPSNTEIELDGAIINLNKLDTDACIFTNSDHTRGSSNIKIWGSGVLNGNRHLSTAGNHYAVNFENVEKSLVELYIDNFRTLEARLYQSDCVVRNLRFYNMPKEEEKIMQFTEEEIADWLWVGTPVSWYIDKLYPASGDTCLKVTIDKNKTVQLYNKKWEKAGVIPDLRYKCLSFWLKIDGDYTPEQLQEIVSMVRLEFEGADGTKTITYNTYLKSFNSTGWVRIFLYPWNIKSLSQSMEKIKRFKLVFDTYNTGSLEGPFTVYIDDLTVIPNIDGGKVCFSADDGHSSWKKVESILNQYGYNGCYNVSPAKAYFSGEHYGDILDILKVIAENGGEIASHSYTHNVHQDNLWEELTRSKETLQKDHLGEINFMAIPGGYSIWTGDMIADCHQVYFGVRSTLPSICSKGEKVPVFSTVPIILSENLENTKNKIAWAVNNHENVALYFHRLDGIDMNEARLHDICEWLYDKGIPVATYSHMFPDRK